VVWHRHRDLWHRMECDGSVMALAGGRMVSYLICRVNRHFGSVLLRDGWVAAYDPKKTFIYRAQPTYNCMATKVGIQIN